MYEGPVEVDLFSVRTTEMCTHTPGRTLASRGSLFAGGELMVTNGSPKAAPSLGHTPRR